MTLNGRLDIAIARQDEIASSGNHGVDEERAFGLPAQGLGIPP
jgi:hypothetical protein